MPKYDDMALNDLRAWKQELIQFKRENAGIKTVTLPNGGTTTLEKESVEQDITDITESINYKLGGGRRFTYLTFR